ncbi:hypothetical protein KC315_g18939, partial [Hortaea werneckii]
EGMFLGEWHSQALGIAAGKSKFELLEREEERKAARPGTCQLWRGTLSSRPSGMPTAAVSGTGDTIDLPPSDIAGRAESPGGASSSGESFDMLHGAEAEKSVLYDGGDDGDLMSEKIAREDRRFHAHAQEGWTGTKVFDKM